MKALLFLPTLLIFSPVWSLPKLNSPVSPTAGKIIKAASIGTDFLDLYEPCDSLVQPSAQFSDGSEASLALSLNKRKGAFGVNTVVIDPGHGGHDPGCHGGSTKEKMVCLAVGKYLAEAIQQNYPDVKVIMTRSTDVFIPLNERAAIATRNKADLFISIHCNAIVGASGTMGTETYVLGLHATEANLSVAKRENESILYEADYETKYDGYDPNSPEAHIILSMFQNAFLEQSLKFADKVQQHAHAHSSRKNRGVKQAGFLVLRHATMPSVLVETGFLTNKTEESFLRTKNGQKSMANALLKAFGDYKAEMEGNSAPALALLDADEKEGTETEAEAVPVAENALADASKTTETAYIKPVKQETTPPPTNVKPTKENPPVGLDASPAAKKKSEAGSASTKILVEKPVSESTSNSQASASQPADIQYRVQLAASPKLLDVNTGKWVKVDYLIEVIQENGLYKYQVVNFATQDEALAAKTKLRSMGFNDAFVVAYQNGVRLK